MLITLAQSACYMPTFKRRSRRRLSVRAPKYLETTWEQHGCEHGIAAAVKLTTVVVSVMAAAEERVQSIVSYST